MLDTSFPSLYTLFQPMIDPASIHTPLFRSRIDSPAMNAYSFQKHSTLIKFSNGYAISIVYGYTIYSTDMNGDSFAKTFDQDLEANSASAVEVAILNPIGEFINFKDGQQVKACVPPDELADIIVWVKNLKKETA